MALDAIIFDLDGTLLDTNAAHVEAWRRSFLAHDHVIPADRIAPEIGKGGDKLVPAILGKSADEKEGDSLRDRTEEEFLKIAAEERFTIYPGAEDLLALLRRKGLRLALATSAAERSLKAMMENVGLDQDELFDVVVNAKDIEESKPAPDVIHVTLQKLGLAPGQCAMIGDTPYDAVACRRAGVTCIGLRTGVHSAGALLGAGARLVYSDIAELLEKIDDALHNVSPTKIRLTDETVERLMRIALEQASLALESGEAPIGCVLADGEGKVIAKGYNEEMASRNRTAHAEIVTFARAAGMIPSDARDLLLVSTLEPCVMCTGAAMQAAVDTIIFGLRAPADSGTERVRPPASPESQMPRIVGDVLADESRALFERWLHRNGNAEQSPYIRQLLSLT